MELSPTPHPVRTRSRRRRTASRLAAGALVLVAVVLLVPLALGMNHSVVRDPAMGAGTAGWRGSLTLNDTVPGDRLRAGDVITFAAPGSGSGRDLVTRRIVAVVGGDAVTRGDARTIVDPWRLDLESGAFSRVAVRVPWVGAVLDSGPGRWAAGSLVVLVGLGVAGWMRGPWRREWGERGERGATPRGRLSGVRH